MPFFGGATIININKNEINDFVNFHCPKLKLAGPVLHVLTLYFWSHGLRTVDIKVLLTFPPNSLISCHYVHHSVRGQFVKPQVSNEAKQM